LFVCLFSFRVSSMGSSVYVVQTDVLF